MEPDEAGVLVLGDGTTADVVACGTAPTAAAAAMTPNNAVRSSDGIFFLFWLVRFTTKNKVGRKARLTGENEGRRVSKRCRQCVSGQPSGYNERRRMERRCAFGSGTREKRWIGKKKKDWTERNLSTDDK